MKKVIFFGLLLMAVVSCSNEFDVAAPWKDIPVVYAILSPQDTANYVRVEKAFLDPSTDATVIAQIPDSLYYDDSKISVFLERSADGQRVQLTRVDGNLEGYIRDNGVFAQQPNWLYKYKPSVTPFVQEGKSYRFILERGDELPTVSAETGMPGAFTFVSPNPFDPKLTFSGTVSPRVQWRTDINGVLFSVQLAIRYRETTNAGVFVGRDTLYWDAVPSVRRSNNNNNGSYQGETTLSNTGFFNFLVNNIPAMSDRLRYFERFDIILTGGGAEIEELQETISANTGIVGAESFPLYSNISEGFGLFTGRNTSSFKNIQVTDETVNYMNSPEADQAVRNLNFRK